MKKLNLKTKIVLTTLAVGMLPMFLVSNYAYFNASSSLETAKTGTLDAVRGTKGAAVVRYFELIRDQVKTFSQSAMIVDATKRFKTNFRKVKAQNGVSPQQTDWMRDQLSSYYTGPFSEEFKNQNGETPNVSHILSQLDAEATILQYFYIQENKHPLGSKHLLDKAADQSDYSKTHNYFHPTIRNYLEKFEYYDIFLVDNETGDIVYSVFKELDYGTSLIDGPYAQTNFGEAFRQANALSNPDDFVLVDYKKYFPSYESPASFIASPIFDGNERVGVAIFQMPIARLNTIMAELSGMGETGETFLVGGDQLMRSDSRLKSDTHSVVASFKKPETGTLKAEAVTKAIAGETGIQFVTDYTGEEALIAYSPVDILGQFKWAMIAKMSTQEAFGVVSSLRMWMIIAGLVAALLVTGVGVYTGRSIADPILQVANALNSGSEKVASASNEIAHSSQQLSETTTQQSAAIEETVSSMEEMGAMLTQTSRGADEGLSMAQSGQKDANNGKNVISNMLTAMNEIQESNDRLEGIVKVINEIKDKTKVINDIVSETRLLSFNASIEAARAGVHGKGFAVVAEEVGKLAAMSGKAAEEIRELLESSTSQVDDVVHSTKDRVDSGKEISKECEQSFVSTADSLDQILRSIESINSASKEQEAGVKQTNKAMNEMESITQQNSTNADTLSRQASSLKVNARDLSGAIGDLRRIILGDTEVKAEPPVTPQGPSETKEDQGLKAVAPTVETPKESPVGRGDNRWKAA